jgi:hypothetical protein
MKFEMEKMINLQKRVKNSVKLPQSGSIETSKEYFVKDASIGKMLEPECEIIPSESIESD